MIQKKEEEKLIGSKDKREKERERRRRAIIRAAKRLIIDKGFKSVTVANIAKKVQISKGAVYLYFESKEEIYGQILVNDIKAFREKSVSLFDPGKTASEMLNDFVHCYVSFFYKERELFRILLNYMLYSEELGFSDEMNRSIIRETNETMSIVEMICRHGVEQGEFKPREEFRKVRNALWGMLDGVIALHLFIGRESTRYERIRSNVAAGLAVITEGLKKSE